MKTSEKLAFGLILLLLLFLPMGYVSAQGAKNIAVCFPLRTNDLGLSQFSSQKPGETLSWRLIGAELDMPQSLANGSPYPEATSLARLMEESLRAGAKIGRIISIDIDALKTLRTEKGEASLFQTKTLQNADAIVFMMYTVQDGTMQFGALLLTKTGEGAFYFSGTRSIFALSEATREAVHAFVAKKILESAAQASGDTTMASAQSSAAPSSLPVIEPWKDKPKYEQASSRFQFSVGGVAVGLSASVVSLGLWYGYQEVAYRNTAFESAVTASGIATGACVAVTAAFLTSAIWNAVLMLQASQ
jgi:hypothetical protein